MTKHFSHDESNVGVEEDERKQERSLRPVTAGWTRFVNGRQYCHFLDVARKPPRRSYIGIPIADPLSRLAFIWGTIATMTDMTYTAFVVPLSLAFCDYGEFGAYWVMDYIGSSIYILDLIFEFHIGFIVRWDTSSVTITDGREAASNYVRHGTFWIDFIACLPVIAQITLSAASISGDALRAVMLIKLLRLLRVIKILSRMNRLDTGGFILQYLSVRLNSVTLLCWNLFYSLMVMVNLIACLWWWAATVQGIDDSWVAVAQLQKPDIDLEGASNASRWIVCAYWALVTMATIGYGDIVPVTTFEMGLVFIIVLAGVAYFGFVLSTVSTIMSMRGPGGDDGGTSVTKYQAMEGWMRRFSVSSHLRSDIRRFVFSHARGGAPTTRDAAFFHGLPLWLKVRVAEELQAASLVSMLGGADAVAAFPPGALSRVTQVTALASDTGVYRPGEVMHRTGSPMEAILFLEEGEVGLFVPGVVRPVRVAAPAVLGAGALFAAYPGGEACATWHSTARAITSVLVWKIDAAHLVRQLSQTAPQGLLAAMSHYQAWTDETVRRLEEAEAKHAQPEAVAAAAAAGGVDPGAAAAEAAALNPGLRLVIDRYRQRAAVAAAAVEEMRKYAEMVEDEVANVVIPLPSHAAAAAAAVAAAGAEAGYGEGEGGEGYDPVNGDYADLEAQGMAADEALERERVRRQVTMQRAERSAGLLRAMLLAGVLRREGETTFVA